MVITALVIKNQWYPLCSCGCGKIVLRPNNKYLQYHDKIGVKRNPDVLKKAWLTRWHGVVPVRSLCKCGCGKVPETWGNRFCRGHRPSRSKPSLNNLPLCACGCKERVKLPGNKWLVGHSSRCRVVTWTDKIREGMAAMTPEEKRKKSEASAKGLKKHNTTPEGRATVQRVVKIMQAAAYSRIITPEEITKREESRRKTLLKGGGFKRGVYHSVKTGNDLYYQSNYELKAFQILESRSDVVSYSRCGFCVYYQKKGKKSRYTPDIEVLLNSGEDLVIEVKPFVFVDDPVNLLKWVAVREYCRLNNKKFVIWTENELGISLTKSMLNYVLPENYKKEH